MWDKLNQHTSLQNAGLLEKLRALPCVVERKLGDSLSVPVYATHAASLRAGKDTIKDRALFAGACNSPRPPLGQGRHKGSSVHA